MAILVIGYFAYTRSLGRGMYILLLGIMIILAITELSTDTWIKELMAPAMSAIKLNAGWVLVYTAGMPFRNHYDLLQWHGHEMFFGYTAAVIAGFLLTVQDQDPLRA